MGSRHRKGNTASQLQTPYTNTRLSYPHQVNLFAYGGKTGLPGEENCNYILGSKVAIQERNKPAIVYILGVLPSGTRMLCRASTLQRLKFLPSDFIWLTLFLLMKILSSKYHGATHFLILLG